MQLTSATASGNKVRVVTSRQLFVTGATVDKPRRPGDGAGNVARMSITGIRRVRASRSSAGNDAVHPIYAVSIAQ